MIVTINFAASDNASRFNDENIRVREDEQSERIRVLEYDSTPYEFKTDLNTHHRSNSRKLENDLAGALDDLRRSQEENHRPKYPTEDKVYIHFEKKYRHKMDSLKSVSACVTDDTLVTLRSRDCFISAAFTVNYF